MRGQQCPCPSHAWGRESLNPLPRGAPHGTVLAGTLYRDRRWQAETPPGLEAPRPHHNTPAPLSPRSALGAHKLLTCPGLTPVGTGLDQADGVGAQAAAVARPPVAVRSSPVQVQHVAQGLPTRRPCLPAPAARCPHLQGLQEGQGGDGGQGAGGQWRLVCSPGKGRREEEEEEAGEGMEQSHAGGWEGRAACRQGKVRLAGSRIRESLQSCFSLQRGTRKKGPQVPPAVTKAGQPCQLLQRNRKLGWALYTKKGVQIPD